ncbi:MAG: hypothetical protein RR244_04115 [Oscillospiraceae bacterium]
MAIITAIIVEKTKAVIRKFLAFEGFKTLSHTERLLSTHRE